MDLFLKRSGFHTTLCKYLHTLYHLGWGFLIWMKLYGDLDQHRPGVGWTVKVLCLRSAGLEFKPGYHWINTKSGSLSLSSFQGWQNEYHCVDNQGQCISGTAPPQKMKQATYKYISTSHLIPWRFITSSCLIKHISQETSSIILFNKEKQTFKNGFPIK